MNIKGYSYAKIINSTQILVVIGDDMIIYDVQAKEIIRKITLPFKYNRYPIAVIDQFILFVVDQLLYKFNLLTLNLAEKVTLPTPKQGPTDQFFQNQNQLVFVNTENKKTYVINQKGEFFVGEVLDDISKYDQFQFYKLEGNKIYSKSGEVLFEGMNTFEKSSYSLYRRYTICLVDDQGYLKILVKQQSKDMKMIKELKSVNCQKVEFKVEKFEDKELEQIKKDNKEAIKKGKQIKVVKKVVAKSGLKKPKIVKKDAEKEPQKEENKEEKKPAAKPKKPVKKVVKKTEKKEEKEEKKPEKKEDDEYSYSDYSDYSYSDYSYSEESQKKDKSKKQQQELEPEVVVKSQYEEIELNCNEDQEPEPFENIQFPEFKEEQQISIDMKSLQSEQETSFRSLQFPKTIGIQPIPENDSWKVKMFKLKVVLPTVEQLQDKKQFKFIRFCQENKYDLTDTTYILYYYIQFLISLKVIDKQHVQPPMSNVQSDSQFKQFLSEKQSKSADQDLLKEYINYLYEYPLSNINLLMPNENTMKLDKDFVNYLNMKRSSSISSQEIRERYFYYLIDNKYFVLNITADEECQKQVQRQQCITEMKEDLILDDLEAFYVTFSDNHLDISTIIPIPEHMTNNAEFVKYMKLHSVEKSLDSYFAYLMEINYINIKNIMKKYNYDSRAQLKFYQDYLTQKEQGDSDLQFFKYLVEKDLFTTDMIVNKTLEVSPVDQILELRDMHVCYKHIYPPFEKEKSDQLINNLVKETVSLFPKMQYMRQNTNFNLFLRKKNVYCLSYYETKMLYLNYLIESDIIVVQDSIPSQIKMIQNPDFKKFMVDRSVVTNNLAYLQYLYLEFLNQTGDFNYQNILPFVEDLMQIDEFDMYLFQNKYLPGSNEEVFFLYILWCYTAHILNNDLLVDMLEGMLHDEQFDDYCVQNAIDLQSQTFDEKLRTLQQFYAMSTENLCDETVTESFEEIEKNEEFETFLIDYQTELSQDTYKYWYIQFLRKQGKSPEAFQDFAFMLRQRINYIKPKKRVCGKTFQDKVKFFSGL